MPQNPLERDIDIAESGLRGQLAAIDKATGEVAPVGKRLLTRREKWLRGLTTPANGWLPLQAKFMVQTAIRLKNGGKV